MLMIDGKCGLIDYVCSFFVDNLKEIKVG